MPCSTCSGTMQRVNEGENPRVFWCPRCGTIHSVVGDKPEATESREMESPKLVARARSLADGHKDCASSIAVAGVFECVALPENREPLSVNPDEVPEATRIEACLRAEYVYWRDADLPEDIAGITATGALANVLAACAGFYAPWHPFKAPMRQQHNAAPSELTDWQANDPQLSERQREAEVLISGYWMQHYLNKGHCSLCGQSGIIHTEAARTAAGLFVGRANFCICPNGQKLRQHRPDALQGGD